MSKIVCLSVLIPIIMMIRVCVWNVSLHVDFVKAYQNAVHVWLVFSLEHSAWMLKIVQLELSLTLLPSNANHVLFPVHSAANQVQIVQLAKIHICLLQVRTSVLRVVLMACTLKMAYIVLHV